jgi:RNA polymerase-interacting CarD/CdnL/TRCF family regulator
MGKIKSLYLIGDMVVHRTHGVGQIDGVEHKPINGVEVECFKVKTENGTYWFPTESLDNPRIHPVASQELIQKAVEILQSAPTSLEDDPLEWKARIDNVQADGDFLAISGLVRDLAVLKTKKKLNRAQDQALNNLKDRLLREWAAGLGVDAQSIRPKLQTYLQVSNT